jgi:hypothetical protein
MKEALDVCLDPSLAKSVKLSNWVVVCLALAITGLSIFAFVHFADISKDRTRLEQELMSIKKSGSSKDKELEILRTYANADKETSEGHQNGMQQMQSGGNSGTNAEFGIGNGVMSSTTGTTLGQALSSGNERSRLMTTAFKESDEDKLSDKDGVPLESQIPTFDNGDSSSQAPMTGVTPQSYGQPDHSVHF